MRKKYVTSLLSLCMIFTVVNPIVIASESVTMDTVLEEEMQDVEEATDSIVETEQDIITDENVYSDSDVEEIIMDEPESSEGIQISEYANEENEPVIVTYASDGYTQINCNDEKSYPIEFKYENNVLYFQVQKDVSTAAMPDIQKVMAANWIRDHQEEAKSVEEIVIGAGITYIGECNFKADEAAGCFANVKKVTIKGTLSGGIGESAFQNEKNLKEFNFSNVSNIGANAFSQTGIENIVFPADQITLGNRAFYGCESLKTVKANEITLAESVFEKCSVLETFSCANKITSVPNSAFAYTALKDFDFSEVTSVGSSSFRGTKLQNIAFGNIITAGRNAFAGCGDLKNVCYPGTEADWKQISARFTGSVFNIHCQGEAAPVHATCETDGVKILKCEICGGEYTDGTVEPALGHKPASDYTIDKEATCTEEGEKSKHCMREGCDEREDIQTIPVDKENHDWTSEVTIQPTCTADGVYTFTCSRCKATKTEAIPATGHKWSDWKKNADATVFATEQQERTCATCGKTEIQSVGSKLTATATVTMSSVPLKTKQTTAALKVNGLAKGDSVKSWKSSNTKVFTVKGNADGTCKLTGKKKGSAKLEITLASGLKKTVTVKVQTKSVATKKLSGLSKSVTLKKGAKMNLKPVVAPATSQQKVIYKSSNKKIVTVSKNGKIKGVKKGKATITVKSGKVTKKIKVTVK